MANNLVTLIDKSGDKTVVEEGSVGHQHYSDRGYRPQDTVETPDSAPESPIVSNESGDTNETDKLAGAPSARRKRTTRRRSS